MVQRLIRGQPPSPPQSTDGDLPSDVGQITDMYSMYGGQTAAPYGGSGSENDVSFDQQSSLAIDIQYAGPTSDCSQNTSLHNQLVTDKMRVHTPPADDGAASRNSEPPRWPSPSMIPSGISKPRVLRSPRQRRRTKGRKDSMEQGSRLTAPLSVLTKDMTHIPLKDMEQHVNRPTEERLAETVRKHGKIPRPMNSFMLYRSAYAERTKELFRQQNHQVVSTAAGQSWNNETPEIKLQYERYAAIEKKNHLKAHPGYKFTPAKDKKKRMLDDDRSYIAGYRTTPEASPAQRHISRFSAFSSPDLGSNGWDSGHPTPPDMGHHGLQTDGYFPQSWPTSHPGKSTSGLMLTSDPTQYLQPSSNPDDMHYASSTTLAGLPGAAHHDLLQPQIPTSGSGAGGQLDPQLLDFNEGGNQVYGGSQYPPLWQSESSNNVYFQYPTSPIGFAGASPLQPGVQTLDGRDTWDPSQAAGMEPVGGEFDHWINNPQGY